MSVWKFGDGVPSKSQANKKRISSSEYSTVLYMSSLLNGAKYMRVPQRNKKFRSRLKGWVTFSKGKESKQKRNDHCLCMRSAHGWRDENLFRQGQKRRSIRNMVLCTRQEQSNGSKQKEQKVGSSNYAGILESGLDWVVLNGFGGGGEGQSVNYPSRHPSRQAAMSKEAGNRFRGVRYNRCCVRFACFAWWDTTRTSRV